MLIDWNLRAGGTANESVEPGNPNQPVTGLGISNLQRVPWFNEVILRQQAIESL